MDGKRSTTAVEDLFTNWNVKEYLHNSYNSVSSTLFGLCNRNIFIPYIYDVTRSVNHFVTCQNYMCDAVCMAYQTSWSTPLFVWHCHWFPLLLRNVQSVDVANAFMSYIRHVFCIKCCFYSPLWAELLLMSPSQTLTLTQSWPPFTSPPSRATFAPPTDHWHDNVCCTAMVAQESFCCIIRICYGLYWSMVKLLSLCVYVMAILL